MVEALDKVTSGNYFNEPLAGGLQLSVYQELGRRKGQEDRFCISSNLSSSTPHQLFGVFDGTVGDFASDTVKDLVLPALHDSKSFNKLSSATSSDATKELLRNCFLEMFHKADESLLIECSKASKHYSASTGVVTMLHKDLIVVGHLGDSRMCLMQCPSMLQKPPSQGSLGDNSSTTTADSGLSGANLYGTLSSAQIAERAKGEFLTEDHKPDQPGERKRIEENGGSVEYLHNHQNKPFIRGGDFQQRKLLGESPMQLQYSRAFGAKDLKPFGLSSIPSVSVLEKRDGHIGFILASDGLWDALNAETATQIAIRSYTRGMNPSTELVKTALRSSGDNITCIVVMFHEVFFGGRCLPIP